MIKNLKVRKAFFTLALASVMSMSGCGCTIGEQELTPEEEYDVLDHTDDNEVSLANGLEQVLDIPGHDFKLYATYMCDDISKREWRITSDKFLYIQVNTQGLPDDVVVYIDNIHIDTSIKSKYAVVDGVLQDSMDDHVHSSQLMGFYISDDAKYYGVNAIEGCNQEFLSMTGYSFNGYGTTNAQTKRQLESDYLEKGVYANKIQIVYDLLIKKSTDKDYTNVSVSTDFIVPVTSKLEDLQYEDKEGNVYKKEYNN